MRFEARGSSQSVISQVPQDSEWDEEAHLQIGGLPSNGPHILNEEESAQFMDIMTAAPRQPTERMRRALEDYRRRVTPHKP